MGSDCGSGAAGGALRPWELPDTAENNNDGSVDEGRAERLREQAAREIREHVKSRGTVPGSWARWADDIISPRIPWDRQLNAICTRTRGYVAGKKDYTYKRMSRRQGLVGAARLPGLIAPKPPIAAAVVDTSGSVSDAQLARGLSEMQGMMDATQRGGNHEPLSVFCCDAHVAERQSVRTYKRINLSGGGGTDMRVGMKAAAAMRPKADLVVVFTDGFTPWPQTPPAENPTAVYVAVVWDEQGMTGVPAWMHSILVEDD